MRNSHSPDPWAMEMCVEVQPFMVAPWGYTGPGPHQELTDAEGGQWPSVLLEVYRALREAKRYVQLSPGSTEFSVATGVELAWEGAKMPRQEGGYPHMSCVVGLAPRG